MALPSGRTSWVIAVVTAGALSLTLGSLAASERPSTGSVVLDRRVVKPPLNGAIWRSNAARTGRAAVRIPSELSPRFRIGLRNRLKVSPAVTPRGSLLMATGRSQLLDVALPHSESEARKAFQRPRWRYALGARAVTTPVVDARGSAFVLTADGFAHLVSSDGEGVWRVGLGVRTDKTRVQPLPLSAGSFIIGTNRHVLHLSASGEVLASASSNERLTGSVLPAKHGAWVTTAAGSVLRFAPPEPLQHVGKLGGAAPAGGMVVSSDTLVAVVGGTQLVGFGLLTGARDTLFRARPSELLEGPPSLDRRGRLLVTSFDNRLVRLGPARTQSESFSLTRQPVPSAKPHPRKAMVAISAPALVGEGGKVALARRDGRLVVIGGEGEILESLPGCKRPLGLLPLPPNRLVLACRGGTIMAFGPPARP